MAGERGDDDVFISGCVGTSNDNVFSREGYKGLSMLGPNIARRARIGVGANLLPGVRIGVGAVVIAGAVVTKDVPDGALAMGVRRRSDDGSKRLTAQTTDSMEVPAKRRRNTNRADPPCHQHVSKSQFWLSAGTAVITIGS